MVSALRLLLCVLLLLPLYVSAQEVEVSVDRTEVARGDTVEQCFLFVVCENLIGH